MQVLSRRLVNLEKSSKDFANLSKEKVFFFFERISFFKSLEKSLIFPAYVRLRTRLRWFCLTALKGDFFFMKVLTEGSFEEGQISFSFENKRQVQRVFPYIVRQNYIATERKWGKTSWIAIREKRK